MNFEKPYFDDVYGTNYYKRNPERKAKFYLKEIVKQKKTGNLLDIGCAFGLFLTLAKDTFSCEGADVSEYAINTAKRHLQDTTFYIADITTLDVKGKYDVVTCFDILEHVADLDLSIAKVKAMLKQGGILGCVVPVYDPPTGLFVEMLDKDTTHVHKMARDFWIKKIQDHGFNIKRYVGLIRYLVFNKFYIHVSTVLFRRFCPAIFIIAQKSD